MSDDEDGERTVLVVDDERRYAEAHARMLDDGFETVCAHSGEEALDAFDDTVDAVVLDRQMPGIDGDEVATELRERHGDLPIVMITAVEPDVDILEMGVDDYIIKPVSREELVDAVEEAMSWEAYDATLQDYFSLANKREVLVEEDAVGDTEALAEMEAKIQEAAKRGIIEREETLQAIIASSPTAIVSLDADGKVDIWNRTAEDLFGWTQEEVEGREPPIFSREDQDRIEEVRSRVFVDEPVTDVHVVCEARDGSRVETNLSAAPLRSGGEVYGTVFVMTDITDRIRREQRLDVLNRILRHNLRNSLATIIGHTDVLAEAVDREPEADRANQIVDTAQDLAEIGKKARTLHEALESKQDRPEELPVGTVVEPEVERARDRFPAATIETDLADRDRARASEAMPIAVRNLVENAVEHTDDEEPRVRVSVERDGDHVLVVVSDDGPGIPDHEVEPLHQEREDPMTHGSGIGLWIVKWLVDSADGELAFEGNDHGGTDAIIRLRAA